MSNRYSRMRSLVRRPKVCKKGVIPPSVPAPPPSNLLFWDQFNDTPGTPLLTHTPDVDVVGGGWLARNGGFTVETDYARVVAGTPLPRNVYHADVGRENVIIYAWLFTGNINGRTIGITFNFGPGGYFAVIDLYYGAKKLRFYSWNGYAWSGAQEWSEPTLAANSLYLLTVRLHPTHNTCQLDAGPEHGMWTGVLTGRTTFGIYSHDAQSLRQQDFRVEKYEGP